MGLVGWYRRFIPNFSLIAAPLTNLTKKKVPFNIDQNALQAIEILKNSLISNTVLAHPDFSQPFILATDASKIGIGAILSQLHDGFERPIAYSSKKLTKAQSNYSATELELLAVVEGIKHFRCYLYGRRFTIVTDHRPLKWLMNLKDPTSKLARWSLLLSSYDFEIIHRQGRQHGNVDALSRAFYAEPNHQENECDVLDKFLQCAEHKNIVNNNVVVKTGNLFAAPEGYSLVHCVSQDLAMNKGIALEFKNYFGSVDYLKAQNKNIGEFAHLSLSDKNIYYLITKNKYYDKPSYHNLWSCLIKLKYYCLENNDLHLAMPKVACGLDKLDWNIVYNMIKYIFANTKIKVII